MIVPIAPAEYSRGQKSEVRCLTINRGSNHQSPAQPGAIARCVAVVQKIDRYQVEFDRLGNSNLNLTVKAKQQF